MKRIFLFLLLIGQLCAVSAFAENGTAGPGEEDHHGSLLSPESAIMGLETKNSLTLSQIVQNELQTPVIYIGEQHTDYKDHLVQLGVIMGLARSGRKFAIGMEMFQKPFQPALDKYIAGEISEREFLSQSEFFQRWSMNYLMYRDIIEFAKEHKIPIIALNIREEIVNRVAEVGLEGLSAEEKQEIPRDLDLSNQAYRERLSAIFEHHIKHGGMKFDNFYASQILWDETMAHSVAQYLKEHPEGQMVVLAGAQHVTYKEGIPNRAFRLSGKNFATIIIGCDEGACNRDVSDYLLFSPPADVPEPPLLGIYVSEKPGEPVIEKIGAGGNAEKAGLKKGDILREVDSWPIKSVYDVKIALVNKKAGDVFKVKVLRPGLLGKGKVLEIPLVIQ